MAILLVPNEDPDKFLAMPEGLVGYWWETDNEICVPLVIAEHEGSRIFTGWLTEIETRGKLIFFPTIISARLAAILRKRGYVAAVAKDKEFGYVDGLAKVPPM